MAITIPDPNDLRIAHDYDHKPGVATVALTAPGPLSISATQDDPSGSIKMEKTVAANREAYVGMSVHKSVAKGRGLTALRNTIIAGFAGVTPGARVWIADDGTFTHTAPGTLTDADAVGVGAAANMILFF
jgi:hypothetical protein